MIEKMKKLLRSVARASKGSEVEPGGIFEEGFVAFMGFCFFGAAAGFVPALPAAAVVATAIASAALGFFGTHAIKLHTSAMREVVRGDINGDAEGIGARRHVSHLKWGQEHIASLTKEFRAAASLPPKIERKVQGHLDDIADFAAHVRVYDSAGREQDKIVFTREFFDAQGVLTRVPVGEVKTAMAPAVVQPAASPVAAAQPIRLLKPVQVKEKSASLTP